MSQNKRVTDSRHAESPKSRKSPNLFRDRVASSAVACKMPRILHLLNPWTGPMTAIRHSIAVTVAVLIVSFGSTAVGSILMELNTPFPDSATTLKPNPDGSPPWLTAEFKQVAANQVELTLTAMLSAGNDVRGGQGGGPVQWGWGFNFNPAKDVTDLLFSFVSGNAASDIETAAD